MQAQTHFTNAGGSLTHSINVYSEKLNETLIYQTIILLNLVLCILRAITTALYV